MRFRRGSLVRLSRDRRSIGAVQLLSSANRHSRGALINFQPTDVGLVLRTEEAPSWPGGPIHEVVEVLVPRGSGWIYVDYLSLEAEP